MKAQRSHCPCLSHPTILAAAQGTETDDALPDTSSLLLGTQWGDKNCRTEEFIGTRKPVSVAYQHKQRNCLNREAHLEVLQPSHGITQHVVQEPA